LAETAEQLRADPHDSQAAFIRGDAFDLLGRYDEAVRTYRLALSTSPGRLDDAAALERGFREGGRDGYARARESLQVRDSEWVSAAGSIARIADADGAFRHLERAFEERNPNLRCLTANPWLRPLHADPRFADLARRMNLPLPKP
jgi:tetratricopeptide (TPR) repeat protein